MPIRPLLLITLASSLAALTACEFLPPFAPVGSGETQDTGDTELIDSGTTDTGLLNDTDIDDSGEDSGLLDTGLPAVGYPVSVTNLLDLPWPPYDMNDALPAHFNGAAALDNTPANNTMTDAGVTLGRVLFYDRMLSSDSSTSCASCHPQATGFTDTTPFSTGFAGGQTGRNSMPLANLRYYANGRAFWDERAASLEEQALGPIQDPVEMGLNLTELETRVGNAAHYDVLFLDAFGDETVTAERIGMAIAQFVRSMASYRTRYDTGRAQVNTINQPFPNFSQEENLGKDLFFSPRGNCAVCHVGPAPGQGPVDGIFLMGRARNNGLDGPGAADQGVGDTTGRPQDDGAFKSPSLRSVAVTAPYMHDGRFQTLEEVVDFYNDGVQNHPNLDPVMRRGPGGQPQRLNLTASERAALVSFLETLTDDALNTDPRYADPWK